MFVMLTSFQNTGRSSVSVALGKYARAGFSDRNIAQATRPCLFGASKKKKHGTKKRRPKISKEFMEKHNPNLHQNKTVADAMSQEELDQVNAWNEHGRFESRVPFAKVTLPTGPPPSIDMAEFLIQNEIHDQKINMLVTNNLKSDDTMMYLVELITLDQGGLIQSELKEAVSIILNDTRIKKEDRKTLEKDALPLLEEKSLESKFFVDSIMESEISQKTKKVFGRLVELFQKSSTMKDRLQKLQLEMLPTEIRETVEKEYADLIFSHQSGFIRGGRGKSMKPTMPEELTYYTGTPINSITQQHSVQRDDIVIFVAINSVGSPIFAGKRVVGLAGDIVMDIKGEYWRVPEGCFWAEGDNKKNSHDSRYYGPVPKSNLRFLYDPMEKQDSEKALAEYRAKAPEHQLRFRLTLWGMKCISNFGALVRLVGRLVWLTGRLVFLRLRKNPN